MDRNAARIVDIKSNRLEQATDVLSRAFGGDPMVSYVMGDHDGKNDPRVRLFFSFSCDIRLVLGWPLLGVEEKGELLAEMALTPPGANQWASSLDDSYAELKRLMGPGPSAWFDSYGTWVEAQRPSALHYYVGVLGTDMAAQGQGCGRMLLERVQSMSEADPASTGVGLDTDSEHNVSMYKHFGYEITNYTDLDGMGVWAMFRPNGA
jgi:predicted GNAT family N-acyltransferase